uniref:Vesicle associated membrane protein 1 n=1 Tax=Pelusios castaneus TaxID=367368 RepID=A0A8C8VKC5_9SAUR
SDLAQQPMPGPPEGSALGEDPLGPPPNMSGNRRLQHSQAQIDEVVGIMRVNVEKVLERDVILGQMECKAEELEASASVLKTNAGKLNRKYWWKNSKMMIVLGAICAIVMVAIVFYFCT